MRENRVRENRAVAVQDATDSPLRERGARFATSGRAALLVAAWAFGEALCWPLLPELALAALCS